MNERNGLDKLLVDAGIGTTIRALPSFCTANTIVLRSLFEFFRDTRQPLLIEATSNQVNQYGGYTGLDAQGFLDSMHALADDCGFDPRRLVLGGDHLGPNPWKDKTAQLALEEASSMVASYTAAGFRKIHLDASMPCSDEAALDETVMADRAAMLCASSEAAAKGHPPVYVIGTEVPTPGGSGEDEEQLAVTRPEDIRRTIETHRKAFRRHGVESAWERVVAVVVQPGVEFGNHSVSEFDPEKARDLPAVLAEYPGLAYEAHSTDYQPPQSLSQLVDFGFIFLKVGPALTFALREAIIGLAHIESYLVSADKHSNVVETVYEEMRRNPKHWIGYYGDADEVSYEQLFSLSDRIRYYWAQPKVQAALEVLFDNCEAAHKKYSLLHQYFPDVDRRGISQSREPLAAQLIRARVGRVAQEYVQACK